MDIITIYLAKDGKTEGPFNKEQIDELKKKGSFYDYEWMWDGHAPDWAPVPRKLKNPPSVLPDGTNPTLKRPTPQELQSAPVAQTAPQSIKKSVDIETSNKNFYAILFDDRKTIGGEVSQAHSRGGKFTSISTKAIPFPQGATVWIDLLDEQKDQSAKVKSMITSIQRNGEIWTLDLEWTNCPLL